MKGPVWLFQSCGIASTQSNNTITRRSPGNDLILMVPRLPETSKQTHGSLKWAFTSGDAWAEGSIVRYTVIHCSRHRQMFSMLHFCRLFICVCFIGIRDCKGKEQVWRFEEMNETEVDKVKLTKKQKKMFKKNKKTLDLMGNWLSCQIWLS